jgi:hypothetical protein
MEQKIEVQGKMEEASQSKAGFVPKKCFKECSVITLSSKTSRHSHYLHTPPHVPYLTQGRFSLALPYPPSIHYHPLSLCFSEPYYTQNSSECSEEGTRT